MSHEPGKHSMHDLLRLVFRRKKLFVLSCAVIALAGMIVWHFVPVKYTGNTVFEFSLQTSNDLSNTGEHSFGSLKERAQHDIAGYEAVEQAALAEGFFEGLPRDEQGELTQEGKAARDTLIQDWMKAVTIKFEARTKQEDLVTVSFSDRDPRTAQRMPNALVAGYVNRTYEKLRQDLKDQHDFLQGRVDQCQKLMDELTQRKIKFETEHAGLLPDNPAALHDKLVSTKADLERRQQQQVLTRTTLQRLKALQHQSSTMPTSPSQLVRKPNPQRKTVEDQLLKARNDRTDAVLLKGMTSEHPTVVGMDKQIRELEAQLAATPVDVVEETTYTATPLDLSMAIATSESELEASTGDIARLQTNLQNYEKLWSNFAPVRTDYLQFVKEWDDRNAEAAQWRNRMRSVEEALGATMGNRLAHLKTVQSARELVVPSFPTPLIAFGAAVSGAAILAVGVILLARVMDRTISSSEDVQKYLGLPVQAVIPEIITARQRSMRRLRNWTLGPLLVAAMAVALGLASMSLYLRLQDPPGYRMWVRAPISFMQQQLGQPLARLVRNM